MVSLMWVVVMMMVEVMLMGDPRDAKSGRCGRYICAIFSAGANFWAILGHFWAISAILGHFWANLGHSWAILGTFRSFLGHFLVLFFVAKYASVLFKLLFATLI